MAPSKKKQQAAVAEAVDSSDDEMHMDMEATTPPASSSSGSTEKDDFQKNTPLVLLSTSQKSEMAALAASAAPPPPKLSKKQRKRLSAAKKKSSEGENGTPGTIYLGRIPHGFYENEMTEYFKQFGDVTRVRLSRNKKTGASKHYAFIEFAAEEAARIAAETMDNYLIFNHMLTCKFIPADKVHPSTWTGANKKFKVIPRAKVQRLRQNKVKTTDQHAKQVTRLAKLRQTKLRQLRTLGIEYDLPPVVVLPAAEAEAGAEAEAEARRE
ncbi:hypothetical protein PhCBS80983_g03461 [Powellomyces hirtus]|uniref:RRM domain-containing protein n=1 Tax=Powellomyces hirtus TaxID=109895 RepID=A0A507E2K5_9FUNG|nr:hypothetical protein PhCBS80983_g03461 [Powellomyces hirtus]